jgi:hypothetical protein
VTRYLIGAVLIVASLPAGAQIDHPVKEEYPELSMGSLRFAPIAFAAYASTGAAAHESTATSARTVAGIFDSARSLFVELRFRLAPYDINRGLNKNIYWNRSFVWGLEEKAQNREVLAVPAARAPGPGLFAAPMFDYEFEHLEGLVAIDSEGREHAAHVWGFPRRGGAVWFQADDLPPAALPAFRDAAGLERGYVASMAKVKDGFHVNVIPWTDAKRVDFQSEQNFLRPAAPKPEGEERINDELDLVFDSSGAWRGWLAGYFGRTPLSPTSLREQAISWSELKNRRREAESDASRKLPLIRLQFSPDPDASEYASADSEELLKERDDVGYPITGRVIFSAHALSLALLQRLESVELVVNGKTRPAHLIGVLTQQVAGYLVEPASPLEPPPLGAQPVDGDTMLVLEPAALGDTLRAWSYPDRLDGFETGYDGAQRPRVHSSQGLGAVLAGLDGKPFGLMVEEIRHESIISKESWKKGSPLLRMYTIAELAKLFAQPDKAVDPRLQAPTAAGGRRRAWLGAQTQDINAGLAKLLSLSAATQNGTIGQLVNAVVPGSPAQKAGLSPGDVLLKLREAAKRQDVLIPGKAPSVRNPGRNAVMRFFLPSLNGLDFVLADIAPGTPVVLSYVRGGHEREAQMILDSPPPDVETAPRLRDDAAGLTVQELTADARRRLLLGEDFRGLLVYDVDKGGPARIAGIQPLSLLVQVAGKNVSRLTELEGILAAHRSLGEKSINVRLVYFGKPLYADLRIVMDAMPGARKP